eukprot:15453973-Alexandrium_andersonii.AAC.1
MREHEKRDVGDARLETREHEKRDVGGARQETREHETRYATATTVEPLDPRCNARMTTMRTPRGEHARGTHGTAQPQEPLELRSHSVATQFIKLELKI